MQLKDKIVIVTGASEGIGKATAKLLASRGAKVVLAARSQDKLEVLAKELSDALVVPTDMRKPDDIKNLVEQTLKKFSRIDILINDAGQGIYGPVEKIDLEQYKQVMELNVYGVIRAMQEVIPIMRQQGGGMILNVSSRVSQNYFPQLAAYSSTKYALNAITLTARQELAVDNIDVRVFHPRMTATNFGINAVGSRPDYVTRPSTDRPMPIVDTPEQVAEKIVEQMESDEAETGM